MNLSQHFDKGHKGQQCPNYHHHHVSINTVSLDASVAFYKVLGFHECHRYSDKAVTIVHLLGLGGIVELFCYADSTLLPFDSGGVPHQKRIGLDHFALQVADIHAAYEHLREFRISEVAVGLTGIHYFFISDPDGNRIEIVKDARQFP